MSDPLRSKDVYSVVNSFFGRRSPASGIQSIPGLFLLLPVICCLGWSLVSQVQARDWHAFEGGRWAALPVPAAGQAGFTELSSSQTGITFTNWLPEQRYLTNQILLNGSGVALGDVDGDGGSDLFFCGIDRPSALFRNLGNGRFADITEPAGVACAGQPTCGAVFADLDGNSTLDLLVNGVGSGTRLFLNDGQGHFREATDAWGLRSQAGSTSLALGDIDGDGFLDLYVANYRVTTMRDELEIRFKAKVVNHRYELISVNNRPVTEPDLVGRYTVDPATGILENGEAHVFYRHTGRGKMEALSWTNGTFLDEDGQPMVVPYDWGLSVMFRDLNQDGAPDLYVCNDFHSPDRIWINNGHGRFRAIPRLALRQTSIFSMAIDFADLDRDGYDDFFVADMLSRQHVSRQVQLMDRRPVQFPPGLYQNRPQYSRNTLFWNQGDLTFAEIAQYSGVEASEWTWCPIFLDADLDGYEDLFMLTGHLRDAQNIDISRRIEAIKKQQRLSRLDQLNLRKMFLPLDIPNFAFRNRGDLTFEEVGAAWGFNSHNVTQGAALADLDNDGDLDMVANCLNSGPLILRNNSNRPRLAVRLRGLPPNTQGIGSRICVTQKDFPFQSQEVICGGRYLSGDDPMRVFAANPEGDITLLVQWRSGRRSLISHARANRLYEIDEAAAVPLISQPSLPAWPGQSFHPAPFFELINGNLNQVHHEEPFDDYQRQPLLPFKLSQLGPGLCWFDWDGDGFEELMVASGRGAPMTVLGNKGPHGFVPGQEPPLDRRATRDQTTILGWIGPDGQPSLLVGTSDYEDGPTNSPLALLYSRAEKTITELCSVQSAGIGPLALADVNGNGHLDLFVGGRVIPGQFPKPAQSWFFQNIAGKFELQPAASQPLQGLVSGALWSDLDSDGIPELLLACHVGPIRIFRRDQGAFREITDLLGFNRFLGLWNSISAGDFDGDGRMDIVAGNWGRNSCYQSALSRPIHFYFGDLDGNGVVELVEAYYEKELDKIVPRRDWGVLSAAMPFILEKYQSYTAFSTAGVSDFLGPRMAEMQDLVINTLDSMLFLNRGGQFEARPLPFSAQLSPIFGIAVADLDGDGHEDIVACQNFFEVPPLISRLDAGRGVWLKGDGRGQFEEISGQESGLIIYGEGRGLALCDFDHDGRVDLAVAQNANATHVYRNRQAQPGLRVLLQGPPGNLLGIGAQIRLRYSDGHLGPVREIHAGGGYWSQDAATQVLSLAGNPESIQVRWPGGKITKTPIPTRAREIRISIDASLSQPIK